MNEPPHTDKSPPVEPSDVVEPLDDDWELQPVTDEVDPYHFDAVPVPDQLREQMLKEPLPRLDPRYQDTLPPPRRAAADAPLPGSIPAPPPPEELEPMGVAPSSFPPPRPSGPPDPPEDAMGARASEPPSSRARGRSSWPVPSEETSKRWLTISLAVFAILVVAWLMFGRGSSDESAPQGTASVSPAAPGLDAGALGAIAANSSASAALSVQPVATAPAPTIGTAVPSERVAGQTNAAASSSRDPEHRLPSAGSSSRSNPQSRTPWVTPR